MASLQPDLPSLPQVLQLAALIPATRAAPSALALLQPFLDLIRPAWLSSFLFTPEPIHLHHFLSPTFASRAFVSSTCTTRIEPPSLPLPFDETHHCTSRTLYLPALSLPHLTLGFGALEILARSGPFWRSAHSDPAAPPVCAACLPLRFIRDARRNLLVELFDIDDAVMLYLTRYLSPTHTHVVTALFTRSALVAALAAAHPHPLLAALHFITSEHHTRACQVCPPLPASPCACLRAAAAPPAHPFDAPAFAPTMLPHLGLHFAASDKLLFARGRPRRHVVTGARMLVQGAVDPLFVHHVATWAATSYLAGARRDPRSGMTPIISSHVRKLGDLFTLSPSLLRRADRKPRAPGDAHLHVDDGLNDQRVLQYLLDDEFKRQHDAAEEDAAAVHSLDGALDLTLNHNADRTAAPDAVPDVPPISSGYVYTVAPSAAAPAEEGLEDWWAARCEARERAPERAPPLGESELDASTTVVWEGLLSPELGRSSESNASMSVFREEAPPVAARMESVVDAAAEAEAEEKLRARRLKARERREKNRLCAQRSNRRAKAERDGLKAELRSWREKLELLRAKEMALRQMNLELRRSFAERAS